MKRGLFRTWDSFLGDCALIDRSAGDAAPLLVREIYEALDFQPLFDDLPMASPYIDLAGYPERQTQHLQF